MADFSFLSETPDSAAVESILAQAMDLAVLEQVSSINLSGTSESLLPTDLETRFRKLKSFPQTKTPSSSLTSQIKPTPISSPDENLKPQTPKNDLNPISKNGYGSSPSVSSMEEEEEGLSPKAKTCCFWSPPKRVLKKKSKIGEFDWVKEDGVLSDLGTFSLKEQNRKLKKVLKEQEKVTKEAEKVVEWAKHASARMDDFVIHDILSDDDEMPK